MPTADLELPARTSSPRVFFSYSHDDERHKEWVLALADRLVANGVDVLLDRWNLRLGSNLQHFIESGLNEADRVLAICTSGYVEKANKQIGGVGFEKMILTDTIMRDLHKNTVIPLLRANGASAIPTFLSGRMYIDFRDDQAYEKQYAELLRELHGKQIVARPPIGANPFENGAEPLLEFSRERFVSRDLEGQVAFDYSNNNGRYVLGIGDLSFETVWSESWTDSIYVYSVGSGMDSLSLARGVSSLNELTDVSRFDNSSKRRQAKLNDIVIWRNKAGYYLATKIEAVSIRSGDWNDEVTFSYIVQPNRTPVFTDLVGKI